MSGERRVFKWVIVVVVAAVLAVFVLVAFPAYQDYAMRARVAQGLSLAAAAQAAVAENAAAGQADLSAGWSFPGPIGAVTNIWINTINGTVTISYTSAAGGPGNILQVPNAPLGTPLVAGTRPAGDIVWFCDKAATTLAVRYRPAGCR
jgi:type IV pilus assembly protein PilA